MMWEFFSHDSVRLPLNLSLEVVGIDRKVHIPADYWTALILYLTKSFHFQLYLVFNQSF